MLSSQICALRWGRVSHLAGYADPTKTAIAKGTSTADQCSEVQNNVGTCVSDWHKFDTTETRFVPVDDLPKENAATSAEVSGADLDFTHKNDCPIYIAELTASHPIIATHWGFLS